MNFLCFFKLLASRHTTFGHLGQLEDFPGGGVVKNMPADSGDTVDTGLVPGLRSSSGKGMATHSSILAWKIPWTEEHGGLQSIGLQRVRHN